MDQLTDTRAVWLDPSTPLGDTEQSALQCAGWQVRPVRTLEEFAREAAAADAAVIRAWSDVEIVRDAQVQLQRASIHVPIVCRLDPNALHMATTLARSGVEHIIGAGDWSAVSWRAVATELRSRAKQAVPMDKRRSVVFVDPASQRLLALAQRVGQAEVTALILGPTGTGKEVLARVLHESSQRARGPFLALNCAAMPEPLVEDLLFGHERGAFTGAHRDHPGLFEQAQGGTLFLDEIGEMPMHLQSKLLRVLQEREVTRLGGRGSLRIDVRIVAATNKDLRRAIAEREFREDLYYRIATFQLRLLPLSHRRGDVLPIAAQYLAQHGGGQRAWRMTAEAQQCLLEYAWPGNVRELENVMLRATVLCTDGCITPAHLMFDAWEPTVGTDWHEPSVAAAEIDGGYEGGVEESGMAQTAGGLGQLCGVQQPDASPAPDLHRAIKHNEHQIIMAAIASSSSRTEAAERLGISPRTLRYKLAQLRELGLHAALTD